MRYIVTVKLPRNKDHNPKNKMTGRCPVSGNLCTDVTGEHHTVLISSELSIETVREEWAKKYHVTRVELV